MDYSTNTTPVGVTQTVALELIDSAGTATPIEGELQYHPGDPYAVTTVFRTAHSAVQWTFGRDLLSSGLYEPTGDGDVHIWPCLDADGHAVVIVELCSPEGEALIQARTGDLSAFVTRMHEAVVPGTEGEYVDLDGAIAAILDAGSA